MRIKLVIIGILLALLPTISAQTSSAAVYSNAEIPEIMEISVNIGFFGRALKAESKIKVKRNVNSLQFWSVNYVGFLSDEGKNILKEPCSDIIKNLGFAFQANSNTLVSSQKVSDWYIETFESTSFIGPNPSNINFCPGEIYAKSIYLTDETGSQRATQIEKICIAGCKKLGIESLWSTTGGPVRDQFDQKSGTWTPIIISPLWNASSSTAKCKQIISANENKYIGPIAVYEGCNQNINFNSLNFQLTDASIKEAEQNFNKQIENQKYFEKFLQSEYKEFRFSTQKFAKEQPVTYKLKVKPLVNEINEYFEKNRIEMSFGGESNQYLIGLKQRITKILLILQKESKSTAGNPKSITCVKGKLTKTITGSNPKCPSGFTKK
jgi:hypothetical protein